MFRDDCAVFAPPRAASTRRDAWFISVFFLLVHMCIISYSANVMCNEGDIYFLIFGSQILLARCVIYRCRRCCCVFFFLKLLNTQTLCLFKGVQIASFRFCSLYGTSVRHIVY